MPSMPQAWKAVAAPNLNHSWLCCRTVECGVCEGQWQAPLPAAQAPWQGSGIQGYAPCEL
jgi:hypothetical protein